MDDLKVRITLGDTTLEGTLDRLLRRRNFQKWSMTMQGLTRSCRKLLPYRELNIRKTRNITMCIP